MEKYNFIVLAPNRWDDVWMNRQHLFSIIGKEHNVIYSNAPFFYWDRNLARFRSAPFFGKTVKVNNVFNLEFPKFLLRIPKLSIWDRLIKSLFIKKVKDKIKPNCRTVLYIFNPIYGEYINDLPHDFIVYHPYDDFDNLYSDNIAKEGEQLLLAKADIMFTTSKLLQRNYQQRFHDKDRVHFIPNGVDFNLFSNVSDDVFGIKKDSDRAKIGYTGSINAKIDISLLHDIFNELSYCDFYITGSEGKIDSFQSKDMIKLKELSNVYFLGNKKLDNVPSYMHAMDINIIPYRTDPDSFANAGYPLKLHEYLTVGKPIICSPIDSAFEFEDVISIKMGTHEWVEEINRIINSDDIQSMSSMKLRKNVAKENTWKKRTESILEIIPKFI
jgi:glycosyltransferase involved in cell wall biosynthesis